MFFFDIGHDIDISMLVNNRDLIKNFINSNFIVAGKIYNLAATINVPINNHYTCFLINYKNTVNNIDLDGNYYYDDLQKPLYLKKINIQDYKEQNLLSFLCLKNVYILMYQREH